METDNQEANRKRKSTDKNSAHPNKKVCLPALLLMILTQAHLTLAGNFTDCATYAPTQIPPNFNQHDAHVELQMQSMPTLDHLQTPETRIVYQSNGPPQWQQPTTLYTTGCEAPSADQIHCPESIDTLKFPESTLPHPPPHHPITNQWHLYITTMVVTTICLLAITLAHTVNWMPHTKHRTQSQIRALRVQLSIYQTSHLNTHSIAKMAAGTYNMSLTLTKISLSWTLRAIPHIPHPPGGCSATG